MAIFRCNKCGHLREVTNDYVGKSVKCPSCKEIGPIHDAVKFIDMVLAKYREQSKELRVLQHHRSLSEASVSPSDEQGSLTDIDLFNTTALASHQQYEPILAWFKKRQIELEVNSQAVDTSGFFDEVAVQLGDNYETLKFVSDQIKYAQGKGFDSAKIQLNKKSKKEITEITQFSKLLYEYSFVARYNYDKKEKVIWLTLQTAVTVTRFFNGIWMEWYVLMKLLTFFREKSMPAACMRSLSVKFPNEDSNELDVFFLVGEVPICIECKSGEYRKYIQKYSELRKRLKLEKENFLLCVIDLSDEQIQGLNSMYDITFVNQRSLLQHVEKLCGQYNEVK